MVRWLEPKGGGAETPGSVANSGRTLKSAASCSSATVLVLLEKTRSPTGTLPPSNRITKGGTVPVGIKERGAVDVGDRLRCGLSHVGAGVELELDQPYALDRFAFDMLDAGDVEEVVLIIVDDEPFHLRRVHAAVGLGHIQDGNPQIW